MECPYCKKELKKGAIPGDTYSLKWYPESESGDLFGEKGIRLSPPSLLAVKAEAWYCADCHMVIVPVKEFEEIGDKIARKWNDLTGKASEKLDEARSRREEEKRKKKRASDRKRDPWEID